MTVNKCSAVVFYMERERGSKLQSHLIKTRPCAEPAKSGGYCQAHNYMPVILAEVAKIGYAELQLNEYKSAGGSREEWQHEINRLPAPGSWLCMFTSAEVESFKKFHKPSPYEQIVNAIKKYNQAIIDARMSILESTSAA